jgi:hypothetical protein
MEQLFPIPEKLERGHPSFWADMGQPPKNAPAGSVLFNSAQLVRKHFKYLGFCDSKLATPSRRLMKCTRGLATKQPGKLPSR